MSFLKERTPLAGGARGVCKALASSVGSIFARALQVINTVRFWVAVNVLFIAALHLLPEVLS